MASSWLDVRLLNSFAWFSFFCDLWDVSFVIILEFLSHDVKLMLRLFSSSSFWDSSLSSLLRWTCEATLLLKTISMKNTMLFYKIVMWITIYALKKCILKNHTHTHTHTNKKCTYIHIHEGIYTYTYCIYIYAYILCMYVYTHVRARVTF